MQYVYMDSVISAQISNGVVRIQLGVSEPVKEGENAQEATKNLTYELVMPVVGFTELANSCVRIGSELVARGILKSGDQKPSSQ